MNIFADQVTIILWDLYKRRLEANILYPVAKCSTDMVGKHILVSFSNGIMLFLKEYLIPFISF